MGFLRFIASGARNIFANSAGSIIVTLAGAVVVTLVASHFYDEWAEERAAGKVRDAVTEKCEAERDNQREFEKGVNNDLKKVGTDDIFDIIN